MLLVTEVAQARALLKYITLQQVESIVEIAYNLLNIVSKPKDKAIIQKRKAFLKKLVDKKRKLGLKRTLIIRHRVKLLKTLLHFKKVLLNLLK